MSLTTKFPLYKVGATGIAQLTSTYIEPHQICSPRMLTMKKGRRVHWTVGKMFLFQRHSLTII